MIEYCCGFLFDEESNQLLLIKKNRPVFQLGKLNGIGGKLESLYKLNDRKVMESPIQAMVREFEEEANLKIEDWTLFCTLVDESENWKVYFYKAFGDVSKAKQITDEELVIVDRSNLPDNCMGNLYWLIPMALHENHSYEVIEK